MTSPKAVYWKNGCTKIPVKQIKVMLPTAIRHPELATHAFEASVAKTRRLILPF